MNLEEAVEAIAANPAWGRVAAMRCLNAGFQCEYCGFGFLDSPVAYKQIQFDHIVPKSLTQDNSEENIATVCRTCNMDWKSRWDPRAVAGKEATREELIEACRQHVGKKMTDFKKEVARLSEIYRAVQPAAAADGASPRN